MGFGLLIALEGIDGAGKTTIAKMIVERLDRLGIEARYTMEPTRSLFGRILREMALESGVDPRLEALLFAADRIYHLEKVVKPLLARGVIVVSDRYLHSSLAYQSVTTGDSRWVEELNKFARKPDLGIYLDVRPSEGLKRLKRRKTRFEDESFLEKVRRRYLEYVRLGELVRVDAERPLNDVFSEVAMIVEETLRRYGFIE
ncbi:MAG: dTMP kinase [Thaumarchaeota archaeon]|nr:MAG: dTMP kinase [Nitrososphaerota archaeon]